MTQKKYKIKIVALLLLIVFVAMCFVGCNLITTDNKKDMQQVVAEVNLQKDTDALKDAFSTLSIASDSFDASRLNDLHLQNTTILKRDLLTAYLSYGYQQVGSMGIEEVINTIMKNLTNSRLNLQLLMLYYLYKGEVCIDTTIYNVTDDTEYTANGLAGTQRKMSTNVFGDTAISVANFNGRTNIQNDNATRRNLETVVAGYKFFLTKREQNYIINAVNTSINDAIDRYEKEALNLKENSSEEDRGVPSGANQTNLYNLDDSSVVGIYTGSQSAASVQGYTPLPNSTQTTRKKAYAQFIVSLANNGLIERGDNWNDITTLDYYLIECITQYESLLGTKFSATIATLQNSIAEGVQQEYNRLVELQKLQTDSNFVSTMDAVTDTGAIVAAPKGKFGYIYNLLIPFSTSQASSVNGLKEQQGTTTNFYTERNSIAKGIVATDQRASWINGNTNYSFNATNVRTNYVTQMAAGAGNKQFFTNNTSATTNYLFFNENFGQYGRAEGLTRYAGLYAFNGTVTPEEDGKFYVRPAQVGIEDFIKNEFEGYLNFILGTGSVSSKSFNWTKKYTPNSNNYEFAIVYENQITLDNNYYPNPSNYGKAYKAMAAVNELVYAYSTDTGSLSKPYGYGMGLNVPTSYVPEFEYAGNQLLKKQEGSYCAVVTDYGVHILYLVRLYDNAAGAKAVETYDPSQVGTVGTFSHFFYNATVNSVIGTFNSGIRGEYMEKINTNATVVLYKNRYKDLYGR